MLMIYMHFVIDGDPPLFLLQGQLAMSPISAKKMKLDRSPIR